MNHFWKAALIIPASLAVTAMTATSSVAVSLTYATDVIEYNQGDIKHDNQELFERQTNTNNALGDVEKGGVTITKDFLSLGFEGSAIFGFGTAFSGEVKIWETTYGTRNQQSDFSEIVDIYVGQTLDDFQLLGTVKNIEDNAYDKDTQAGVVQGGASLFTTDVFGDEVFNFVKVVDVSDQKFNGRDGFDINAIAVQSVPEPASVLGLMTVGLLGASSTLKKRQNKG